MDEGMKLEINFIIKKFRKLPISEKREIYEQINSDDKDLIVRGGTTLLKLLVDNSREMAKSVGGFDDWIVWTEDIAPKTASIWAYFKDSLQKTDNGFKIATIA